MSIMRDATTSAPSRQGVYETGGIKAYFLLTLLCLAFFFDYADRFILSAVLPFIKADWQLSDQALGALTGILAVPMALLALPMAVAVDRWSRKKMIALSVGFWSLATLACAFARNYNELLIFRALTGVGEAGYAPAAVAAIAAAFAYHQRARVTGIWDAFAPMGSAAGFILGGLIGTLYGWRHAFGIMALPGFLLALLFLFAQDYQTVSLKKTDSTGETPRLAAAVGEIFQIPSLRFVWAGFTLNFAVNTAVMAWLPSYFIRFHHMNEQAAGKIAGGLALMALIGAPAGGIIADRWMRTRPDARLRICAITSAGSGVSLIAALLTAGTPAFWPLMVLFGLFSVAFLAPGAAVIQDVVHPGLRAIAYGLNVTFLNLLGASWAPGFIGWASDVWGLDRALCLLPVLALAAAVSFMRGAAHYPSDLSRVEKVVLMKD